MSAASEATERSNCAGAAARRSERPGLGRSYDGYIALGSFTVEIDAR